MSKLIFFILCIGLIFISCNNNELKSFQTLLNDQTEKWLEARIDGFYYSFVFDRDWIHTIQKDLIVKVKMAEPLEQNSEKMDLAYEVSGFLSPPKISSDYETKIRDSACGYEIFFIFSFVDKDGFVIHKFEMSDWITQSAINHEIYKKAVRFDEEEIIEKRVKAKALIENIIPYNVAKRTAKINYTLRVKTLQKKVDASDEYPTSFQKKETIFDLYE